MMTFKVEYDSILSKELHVIINDIISFPLIIYDPMITKMHKVKNNSIQDILKDDKYQLLINPPEAQQSDWTWETFNGGIKFIGQINEAFIPFNMEFWLS